ncbi:MAG: class I SAM-dependent methyltransferase [Planctomycetes bacterium]|jgi:SAM-dependent methyltransferase|nr:class I SAM-dependent methyltransferase [Planctomycetota bacterium]
MDNLKKLNLGSGEDKKVGYVNVDWNELTKPDVAHDLNRLPYPFADDAFDRIEASHVLEHLDKPFAVMRELHRILKPDGELAIKVPHFSRGFTHAEHSHGFDISFPQYFNRKFTSSGFLGFEFENVGLSLKWMAFSHLLKYYGYGHGTVAILKVVSQTISFLANLSPAFCSRIWCFWVGGFEEIEFKLKCKK